MPATLKVHKLQTKNVCVRLVKGLHEPYQVLPWTTRPLPERFTEVADWQEAKLRKSSIFWLLSFCFKLLAKKWLKLLQWFKHSVSHKVLHLPLKGQELVGDSQLFPWDYGILMASVLLAWLYTFLKLIVQHYMAVWIKTTWFCHFTMLRFIRE